jgi:DivIVA domain-containing protein
MELTLKRLLEQAEFTLLKGRGRGYDQTEVDDFLDRASAMAAKVEVQLTQALEQAAEAKQGGEPADIDAEVERRVAERMATQPSGPSEEESAEEVRRTIVLAQRTADAAVREAREDAEKLLADARERATTMVTEAEAKAAALTEESETRAATLSTESEERATRAVADAEARAAALSTEAEAQVARERREARQRLASEIGELEGVRESLRSDVTVLERHVEEQRLQLSSTVSELQRLLDDPAGFRLAPVPVLVDPEVPDLTPEPVAEEPAAADAEGASDAASEDDVDGSDPDGSEGVAPEDAAPSPVVIDEAPAADEGAPAPAVIDESSSIDFGDAGEDGGARGADPDSDGDLSSPSAFGAPEPSSAATVAQPLEFDDVDHEVPEVRQNAAEETGPPTAPVDAVDIGIDLTGRPPSAPAVNHDDDAFLAELRKAMADDEPLGPRDHDDAAHHPELFDDDDRRSRRFGRRR